MTPKQRTKIIRQIEKAERELKKPRISIGMLGVVGQASYYALLSASIMLSREIERMKEFRADTGRDE